VLSGCINSSEVVSFCQCLTVIILVNFKPTTQDTCDFRISQNSVQVNLPAVFYPDNLSTQACPPIAIKLTEVVKPV